jgi:hypothetical protein
MRAWFDVATLNKCPVYKIDSNNSVKFILFGPDLSKFKEFSQIQDLIDYAALHSLTLDFKYDS